jgi:hypothetical protein
LTIAIANNFLFAILDSGHVGFNVADRNFFAEEEPPFKDLGDCDGSSDGAELPPRDIEDQSQEVLALKPVRRLDGLRADCADRADLNRILVY